MLFQPRSAGGRWLCQFRRRPLRREPNAREQDREHDKDLADQEFGRGHAGSPRVVKFSAA